MREISDIDVDDLVFHRKDEKKIYPIKITSVFPGKMEMMLRGSFTNDRGIRVNRKFKRSELIHAKNEHTGERRNSDESL